MLKHRNGRFYLGNVSFILPDEMYINPYCEVDIEAGFELVSSDKKLYLTVMGNEVADNAKEEIESIFDEEGCFEQVGEIESLDSGGLKGYCVKYLSTHCFNIECALDLPNNKDAVTLTVWARAKRECSQSEIDMLMDKYRSVLSSVSIE